MNSTQNGIIGINNTIFFFKKKRKTGMYPKSLASQENDDYEP
jgi:hypothetical protein